MAIDLDKVSVKFDGQGHRAGSCSQKNVISRVSDLNDLLQNPGIRDVME